MKSSLLLAIALLSALSLNSFAQTGTEVKSEDNKAPVEKIVKKGKKHHKKESKKEEKKEEKVEAKKEEKKEEAKK